jgi:hypothetical protein
MYSPVTGTGSPLAPPIYVTPDSDGVVGRCTLGIAHEGPPGYGRGDMSAMPLDELMGWACAATGMPAMTVSLQVRYYHPVPLETPLRVYARVTGTEDRRIFVDGSISTQYHAGHSGRRLRLTRPRPHPRPVPAPATYPVMGRHGASAAARPEAGAPSCAATAALVRGPLPRGVPLALWMAGQNVNTVEGESAAGAFGPLS